MSNNYISTRLFARPSFWEGMARLMDFGGTLQSYSTKESGKKADIEAMKNDWRAVGDDMKTAIQNYEHESAKTDN